MLHFSVDVQYPPNLSTFRPSEMTDVCSSILLNNQLTMPAKAAPAPGSLPLAAYFSTLAYLSLLLLSSLISLPRSTAWFYSMAGLELPTHNTSTDRPEPEFLRPFTASPIGTTAWVTLGTALVMLWWGGKIAGWFGSPQTFGMVSGLCDGPVRNTVYRILSN